MKRLTDLFSLSEKVQLGAMALFNGAAKPSPKPQVRVNGKRPSSRNARVKTEDISQKDYLTLFQLMRDHRMLKLRVHGDNQIYQTMLLEVNAEDGYLVIDEPFPSDGVLSGSFRQNVTLEYEREGFSTVIRSVVEMRIIEEGDKYFRLEWPKVEEIQRRDQFRLDVTECWDHDIKITAPGGQKVNAVLDLSATGLRLAFDGNQIDSIYAGTYLAEMRMSLSGCDDLTFGLDITHCHYVPDAELGGVQMTVAGGRFVGLSYRERQAIQRYIFSAQRSQRRQELEQEVIAA